MRIQHLLLLSMLLVLTSVVYYPGLSGGYMFDDMYNLLENSRLNMDDLGLESIKGASLSSDAGMLRRPVSMFSFALNRYFFGTDPYAHKIINLLIHLLNGIGLFLLSHLLLRGYRDFHDPTLSDQAVFWLPVVITGLWLVHPINLTSVLYIVQRMTSLATLFTICGLYLYVTGRLRMLAGKRGLPQILAGLIGFGSLAIFSKESGALLPLYMLVIELALFRFRNRSGKCDLSITGFFVFTLAVPAILFLFYASFNPSVILGGYGLRDFTLIERLLTEGRVLAIYMKLIIMPSISELGLYHDDITLSHGLLDPPSTLIALCTLAALAGGALLILIKQPLISLGILWFFAGHTLESTFFSLEIAHEHRNYLADYGIILSMAVFIAQAPLRRLAPLIRATTPIIILVLFSYTTWLRADQWSNHISHAVYEARHHPASYRANFSAGHAYTQLALNGQPSNTEMAYYHLYQAETLNKTGIAPIVALIRLSFLTKQSVDPAWFDKIKEKLTKYPVTPEDVRSLQTLSECTINACEISDDIIEATFKAALGNESLKSNLRLQAQVNAIYGFYTINTKGDYQKGLEISLKAVELEPSDPRLWDNLIYVLTEMNRLDEAEEQIERFKNTPTRGGNETDYSRLQKAIDIKRMLQVTSEYQTSIAK